ADSIASQQQPGVACAGATGRHVFRYCRAWLLGFEGTVVDLHSNSGDDPGLAACDAWKRSDRRQPNSAKLISDSRFDLVGRETLARVTLVRWCLRASLMLARLHSRLLP